MATQVLYRKWRPQTFQEVVGQRHIVQTLRNALAADDVAHAYLFAGPRGTGKTTTARLLAKGVSCLGQDGEKPCNQCAICKAMNNGRLLDLIEIDAASNRGIDEIRDLRAKVNFSPSQARYKVYILDEAHMLTNEAFNALLKTLEEPPGHVIFVLVTTEPHKLPTTITSRCQRFDFHRLSLSDIIGELERIAELEGVIPPNISEEATQRAALELVARSATGSMRDAISLMDQVMTAGGRKIALEQVQEVLGTARIGATADLVSSLIQKDIGSGLRLISQVIDQGADVRQFTAQVVEYLHGLMLLKVGGLEPSVPVEWVTTMRGQAAEFSARQILEMLRLFNRVGRETGGRTQAQLPLELALVEAILNVREGQEQVTSPTPSPRLPAEEAQNGAITASKTKPETEVVAEVKDPSPAPSLTPGEIGLGQVQAVWPQILRQVRSRSVAAEALLKACEPVGMEEDRIVLGFRYPFHRDKVEEQANRTLIEEAVNSVIGEAHPIRCVLGSEYQAGPLSAASKRPPVSKDQDKFNPDDEPAAPGEPFSEDEVGLIQADKTEAQGQTSVDDKLAAVADDPVVQAMVDQYGARVVDVQ